MIFQSGVSCFPCKTSAGNYIDLGSCDTIEPYKKHCEVTERISVRSSSSSDPFTPCAAQGIHEELPGIAVSSYPLDLVP